MEHPADGHLGQVDAARAVGPLDPLAVLVAEGSDPGTDDLDDVWRCQQLPRKAPPASRSPLRGRSDLRADREIGHAAKAGQHALFHNTWGILCKQNFTFRDAEYLEAIAHWPPKGPMTSTFAKQSASTSRQVHPFLPAAASDAAG